MPQSIFLAKATQYVDGAAPSSALAGHWDLGVQYVGASKGFIRRDLASFDLFGGATSGRPLAPSDVILSAELIASAGTIIGPAGWPATIERITRADWDYATADWTRYKTGASWTTAGGDVATPPAAVGFASPAVSGDMTVAGMLGFVTDAIALRGGLVILRLRANDEAPPQTQWCNFEAGLTSPSRPRLRVTYDAAVPSPIARPARDSMPGQPPASATPPASGAGPARASRPASHE